MAHTTLQIQKVETRRQLRQFIRYNYLLYKDNPYSVPDLYEDMLSTFSRTKNPAFEFCEADYFLCLREGRIVGRVAAIINHRANERWQKRAVRFGWIDFEDDTEVSRLLIDTVKAWGRERGMQTIEGPLGFTDMDAEGMLIEGFDQLSTIATIYNHPYYPRHMEALGMEKACDWVERKIYIPAEIPEKHLRISRIIEEKYGMKVRKIGSRAEIRRENLGHRIFALINDAYDNLFGYSRMTDAQIDQYVKAYIPMLDLRMVSLVEDSEGEIVAAGISMGSLSRALQKAHGRLLPFGWWHLLKALKLKHAPMLDLLLVGVRPDYQDKGINALLFTDLIPVYQQMGFEYAESNPELEGNMAVQNQWKYFHNEIHKRRRCYTQPL